MKIKKRSKGYLAKISMIKNNNTDLNDKDTNQNPKTKDNNVNEETQETEKIKP